MPESHQSEPLCALGSLLRELRWMILDLLPYAMGEMRLVSRSWKEITDDWIYSNNAEFFEVLVVENTEESANISFKFIDSTAACFPQLRDLYYDSTLKATIEIDAPETGLKQIHFGIPYDRLEINRFFSLMKMKVRFATINGDLRRNPPMNLFEAAFDLFTKLKKIHAFFCYVTNFDDYTADFVSRLTSAVKIKHFFSNSQFSILSDPRRFLLEIAGSLESISIRQRGFFVNNDKEMLFLGNRDVNWVETFLEMFERGLFELRTDNTRTAHITAKQAAFIAETLSARGKSFVFETSLFDRPIQPKGCNWGLVNGCINFWIVQFWSKK